MKQIDLTIVNGNFLKSYCDCIDISEIKNELQHLMPKPQEIIDNLENIIIADINNIKTKYLNLLNYYSKEESVGTHPIWPPRAFTFGQLTHNDLASVRIPKRATKSL